MLCQVSVQCYLRQSNGSDFSSLHWRVALFSDFNRLFELLRPGFAPYGSNAFFFVLEFYEQFSCRKRILLIQSLWVDYQVCLRPIFSDSAKRYSLAIFILVSWFRGIRGRPNALINYSCSVLGIVLINRSFVMIAKILFTLKYIRNFFFFLEFHLSNEFHHFSVQICRCSKTPFVPTFTTGGPDVVCVTEWIY